MLGAARVGEGVAAREHGALALLQRRLTAADEAHCRLIHALHLELRGRIPERIGTRARSSSERVRWYCESTTATPSASKSTAGLRRRGLRGAVDEDDATRVTHAMGRLLLCVQPNAARYGA